MLYLSNACFSDILCRNSQPCSKGFFAVLLEKKLNICYRFRSFQGRFFVCFWGNFGIICFFKAFFAKCLMQKCECVVPEQCMFQ